MKKILIIIGSILVLFPSIAKADMGAPEFKPYEIVVVNPEGTDAYDEPSDTTPSNKLPVGTKCTVYSEKIYQSDVLLSVSCEGYSYTNKIFDVNYIKNSNDIKLENGDHEFYYKNGPKYKYYALGDIELYVDEYLLSGKNGKVIPAGTEFEAWETESNLWHYYENGDTRGYFYINEQGGFQNPNILRLIDNVVLIGETEKIYKNATGEETINLKIPKFTEVHVDYEAPYYIGSAYSRYKIEYNGAVGWVPSSEISVKYHTKLLYEGEPGIEIYDKMLENKVTNIKLKENTLYDVEYIYEPYYNEWPDYAYTIIDGEYYWVKIHGSNDEDGVFEYVRLADIKYTITMNKDYNLSNGTTIKEGTKLISYFYNSDESKYLITYNDFSGWVELRENAATIESEHLSEGIDYERNNNTINNGINVPTKKEFYNLKTSAIMGVIAAVLISSCAVISLVFIKRKKNNSKTTGNITAQNELNMNEVTSNTNEVGSGIINDTNQNVSVEVTNTQEQNIDNNSQNNI